MIDLIGLLGVFIALAGTAIGLHGMFAMRNLVNATRPEGQKFTGFPLLPATSRPVIRALKAEYPGHPLLKRIPICIGLIMFGIAVMAATNSYNANHSN